MSFFFIISFSSAHVAWQSLSYLASTYYFWVAGTSLLFVTKWRRVLDWFSLDRQHAPDCVQNNLVVVLLDLNGMNAPLDQSDWIIMMHFTVPKISFPRTAPCDFIRQTRLAKCSTPLTLDSFHVFNLAKLKKNSESCLSHKMLTRSLSRKIVPL